MGHGWAFYSHRNRILVQTEIHNLEREKKLTLKQTHQAARRVDPEAWWGFYEFDDMELRRDAHMSDFPRRDSFA